LKTACLVKGKREAASSSRSLLPGRLRICKDLPRWLMAISLGEV
jgi:hypothetical protein